MTGKKRHILSALGISMLAAVSMMAFSASAQAQALPLWLVGGVNPASYPVAIDALIEEAGFADVIGVRLACTSAHIKGNLTAISSATGTIVFLGCKVTLGEESCKLQGNEIKAEVSALTIAGSGDRVRFSPPASGIFAKVTLEDNEFECILIEPEAGSETLNVTGNACGLFEGAIVNATLATQEACLAAGQTTGLFLGNNEAELEARKGKALRTSDGALLTVH